MKEFYIDEQGQLIFCYTPPYDWPIDSILSRLNGEVSISDVIVLDNTIFLTKEFLVERELDSDHSLDDSLDFLVGLPTDDGKYILLDQSVFRTSHRFLFDSKTNFSYKLFCKNKVSAIRALSSVAQSDIYIDLPEHYKYEENHLLLEQYEAFVSKMVTPYEVRLYKNSCAEIAASQFLNINTSFAKKYERYTGKKYRASPHRDVLSKEYLSARVQELEQQRNLLQAALNRQDEPEDYWQQAIADLIPLLYPKYLYVFEKFEFESLGKTKIPDFIAIDNDGNVDVIEIKKANIGNILRKYRDNYVPISEVSCACTQIEHYIFRMMSNKENVEKKIEEKYRSEIGSLKIHIINPQGILIAGTSQNLSEEEKRDFEVAKRMHKHIYDIITYDQLIERLQNTINAYRNMCEREEEKGGGQKDNGV